MRTEQETKLREYGEAWLAASAAQEEANSKRMAARMLLDHSLKQLVRFESPAPSLLMDDGVVLTFRYTGNRDSEIEVSRTRLVTPEEGADAR